MAQRRRRILLVFSKVGYEYRDVAAAARALDIEVVPASDRCNVLDDPWGDAALPLRFDDVPRSVRHLVEHARREPVDAVIAVGDAASVIAAHTSEALGLPSNSGDAALAARDKAESRARCQAAGVPVPVFQTFPLATPAQDVAAAVRYPCVLKPRGLSASRGVVRADDPGELVRAHARLKAILQDPELAAEQGELARSILVESFVPGGEVAVEGLLTRGKLRVLAVFDKPDPLDGPTFAETLYITPSRLPAETLRAITDVTARAASAIGLRHGPIHAELRLPTSGPIVLEVAGRSIGGLCGRTLRFGTGMGLEELVLRHALGELDLPERQARAAGVYMLPVPRRGVYKGATGVEEAAAIEGIEAVELTAKPGQIVVPLPEGHTYMGFIFATGDDPAAVEATLRRAEARLQLHVTPQLAVS